MDDDAVSPVIGTILMVAIVVVLAAVIFVMLTGQTPAESDKAPQHAGTVDEQRDSYTVARGPNADMSEYEWTITGGDIRWAFNRTATSSDPLATADYQTLGSGDWAAGTSLRFCGDGGAVTGANLQIRHVPSNTLAVDVTFASISACA